MEEAAPARRAPLEKTPTKQATRRPSTKSAAKLKDATPQRLYRSERECEEDYEEQRESLERTKRRYYGTQRCSDVTSKWAFARERPGGREAGAASPRP